VGESRTISFYYYGTYGTALNPYIGGQTGTLLFYADNAISGNGTTSIKLPVTENEWNRITFTIKNTGTTEATYNWGWMILHSNAITVTLDNTNYWKFTGIQVEQKDYATPFAYTTRDGIVTDYSTNAYNTTLSSATSPTWTDDSIIGTGAYKFDGVNDTITIPNIGLTQNIFSLSMWIKPAVDGSGVPMILVPQSNGIDQMIRYSYTSTNICLYIVESSDTNGRSFCSAGGSVPKDKWANIVVILNNQTVQLYVNGTKIADSVETIPIGLWSAQWVLGQRGNSTYYYKGLIDDVLIYRRILTSDEIKRFYDIAIS
jgi:hypothetical protein